MLEIMALFEEKWQKAKETIRERGIFMFNNDLLSDVSLVVPASRDKSEAKKSKMAIPAHKFVLSICSPVFYAMFCGKMADKSDTIELPDCEYEGVLEMLRYLYSEEVKLNESNVMAVFYVAKKYILPSLVDECIDFLQKNLDPENVFCVLPHAQQYDAKNLVDRCWEVIDRTTAEAVKSEEFGTIERSLLEALVKRDSLTISEVELFKAVDLWATKECERQGLIADGNGKRRILGEEIVKGIRFPVMEEIEFMSIVLDSKILTQEELCDVMKNFKGVLISPVGFPEDRRVGTCQSCCRFGSFSSDDDMGGWIHSLDDGMDYDGIEIKVDKDILLYGIHLFGSKDSEYLVDLMISDNQERDYLVHFEDMICSCVSLQCHSGSYYGFDVTFDPVVMKKRKRYWVAAFIAGPNSWYGKDGVNSVNCHGVKFNFKKCRILKRLMNKTSVMTGQFAEFLFKIM